MSDSFAFKTSGTRRLIPRWIRRSPGNSPKTNRMTAPIPPSNTRTYSSPCPTTPTRTACRPGSSRRPTRSTVRPHTCPSGPTCGPVRLRWRAKGSHVTTVLLYTGGSRPFLSYRPSLISKIFFIVLLKICIIEINNNKLYNDRCRMVLLGASEPFFFFTSRSMLVRRKNRSHFFRRFLFFFFCKNPSPY